MTSPDPAWVLLGRQLVQRRAHMDPRFANRSRFATERRVDYRLVYDIEKARRQNFGEGVLASLEGAYGLTPGAIGRFLKAGGEHELEVERDTPPPNVNPYPFPAPSDPAAREEWASFVAAVRDQVQGARAAAESATDPVIAPEPPASAIFPGDKPAQAIWSRPGLSDMEKMRSIGTVRWLYAQGLLPGLKPEDLRGTSVENGNGKP